MPLTYDSAAEEFVLTSPGVVRRFEVGSTPTLENALEALELLNALRAASPKTQARPDPLGMKKTAVDQAVEDYLAGGGHVIVSTYDPVARKPINRLKPKILQAATGSELLAVLGLKKEPKE